MEYPKILKDFVKLSKTKKSLANFSVRKSKEPTITLYKLTNFLPENSGIRERLYYVENNLTELVRCAICNGKSNWTNHQYNKYCSKCVQKSPEQKAKLKKVFNNRYGATSFISSREGKAKRKEAMIKKYGAEHNFQNKKLFENFKKTMIKRHGVPFSMMHQNLKSKIIQSNLNNGGGIGFGYFDIWKKAINNPNYLSDNDLFKIFVRLNDKKWLEQEYKIKSVSKISEEIGISKFIIKNHLKKHGIQCNEFRSDLEKELFLFLSNLIDPGKIIFNTQKIIAPLELDFYIPKYRLAIEINGIYWHSELAGTEKGYHLDKTLKCQKHGIQLLHIFENEWLDPIKQDIWKSIIANRLRRSKRIFARKCELREVPSKEARRFQYENHMQSEANSSVRIGLYYQDELVSLMTFGKPRYNKSVDWELIRLCNKKYYSVIGGASKCFSYFKKRYGGKIISYADLRRSNGNLYKQLGFELARISGPNFFYFKLPELTLYPRIKYQKYKQKNLLETFDPKLTGWKNMQLNGWNRIFDCGNQVWEIDLPRVEPVTMDHLFSYS